MEKMPKAGKYQPVKSYSMIYDKETNNIIGVLEEKDIIDIKTFQKDPDIPGKIRGIYTEDDNMKYVIFSYKGVQHFKPYVKPKKKKEDK